MIREGVRGIVDNGRIYVLMDDIGLLTTRLYNEVFGRQVPQSQLRLQFFTSFNTLEKQELLRQAIRKMAQRFDANVGRDWIALYIAFTFSSGKLVSLRKYGHFFSDIDALMPGLLTNVKSDETGYNRFEKLSESLSRECRKWYVCNGCLPPRSEWTLPSYHYQVNADRRRLVQEEVATMGKTLNGQRSTVNGKRSTVNV